MVAQAQPRVIARAPLGCSLEVTFLADGTAVIGCCQEGLRLPPNEAWYALMLVARLLGREQFQQVKGAIDRAIVGPVPKHMLGLYP
jgi:hypothetical protein